MRHALAAAALYLSALPTWAQAPKDNKVARPQGASPARPVPDTLVPPPSETKSQLEDETRKQCIATLLSKHPETPMEEIATACGK